MAKQPKPGRDAPPTSEPRNGKDERIVYEVTDKAPPYVAGRRLNGAAEIALFEDEARAELLAGHIRPKGMPRQGDA
ncbi:hypothetical protein KYK30_20570 [Shinella yambaruensis]|uniref:Uncharacterized protein n=1 Tax=Shinella yambaruensis TaxID=415996 RepID=A0ABQ5ZK54_9HYPH|nr:hypothetical protein [Shinella yambaruensis]MCJ8027010.1 hypothetical protein [Shinella yambaruensis]MCU7982098.1 hypothetical protein [Shinella yambaruensis]GLR51273.1 hypothetical protein GCM10007923_24810 [Shinella yambaruensis]